MNNKNEQMSKALTPVPMSLRVAMQISGMHFLMSSRTTSIVITAIIVWALAVVRLIGPPLPDETVPLALTVAKFIRAHRWWFIGLYGLIFSFPANLGALMVLVQVQFATFRVYPIYHDPPIPLRAVVPYEPDWSGRRWANFFRKLQQGYDELISTIRRP